MSDTEKAVGPLGEASRGTDHADCDLSLLPPAALRAWGNAFAEGQRKYGRDNWLKGFSQMSVLNHALHHIVSYIDGDRSEDHLGARVMEYRYGDPSRRASS